MIEPWATLLFIGGGSVLLQIGKIVAKKFGQEISTAVVHWGALGLTAIYSFATGGFAGIVLPPLPAGADVMGWLGYVGAVAAIVGTGAASIAGLYDLALKKIYGGIGGVLRTVGVGLLSLFR